MCSWVNCIALTLTTLHAGFYHNNDIVPDSNECVYRFAVKCRALDNNEFLVDILVNYGGVKCKESL